MPYYKETFHKIKEERKERVMETARKHFAKKGFMSTNINQVAKDAGISVGSMYSYFASKEDLFLTLVEECFHVLEGVLKSSYDESLDVYHCIELLLEKAAFYANNYPEYNQIYLDVTTESMAYLAKRLSNQLETITANFYLQIIKEGKEEGLIRKEVNDHILSFYLDNLIMMYQLSFTSDYFKRRMVILLGHELNKDQKAVRKELLNFIKKALVT